ncbi:MAG: hypothetical protein K0Q72_4149 [Armatimonadetes bacterium]|jgi:hypothetical protein|nr:hypothetical protein [Armatimonadota bacterium]
MTFAEVVALAAELPGTEESTSYGTPAVKAYRKLLARLREDGETLALRVDPYERDHLLASNPDVFFLTDHYRAYPYVVVRLAAADPEELRPLLETAWKQVVPARAVAAWKAAQ